MKITKNKLLTKIKRMKKIEIHKQSKNKMKKYLYNINNIELIHNQKSINSKMRLIN